MRFFSKEKSLPKFSSREEYEKWKAGRIRRVDKMRGMTKIGLIVLVCVICLVIGCCYYNIILHERQDIKVKMSSVTNSMEHVAIGVEAYKQELNSWPHCDNIVAIRTSLGVSISTDKISSITVTSPKTEEVTITATIKGIVSRVDGKNLTLTGKQSERGILWVWGGTVASSYFPRNKRN